MRGSKEDYACNCLCQVEVRITIGPSEDCLCSEISLDSEAGRPRTFSTTIPPKL